jgi:protein transport protein SEC61 subunit gamma-like protein
MEQFEEKRTIFSKLKNFVRESVRVLKITKKPTKEEFKTISKVSGLGILIIGLLGFIVHLIDVLLFK